MKRRILLILFGLIILSVTINACTAPTGELYVNSDTTLCPGTYSIDDSDYDGAVIINASNVVLDCDGATFDANGSAGYAVFAQDVTGITVKNCNIQGYTWGGIEFEGVNYSVIDSNNISSCGAYGHGAIFMPYSSYNNITNNRITSNPLNAISIGSWYPTSCQGNRITGNTITDNTAGGVSIQEPSSSTVLEDNYICGNGDSDIDSGNTSLGTGSGNTCDTASNWNDDGATGCAYACAVATTTTSTSTSTTTTTSTTTFCCVVTTTTSTTIAGDLKGDTDGNGTVSDFELLNYINLWVNGQVGDFDVLEAIDNWANP